MPNIRRPSAALTVEQRDKLKAYILAIKGEFTVGHVVKAGAGTCYQVSNEVLRFKRLGVVMPVRPSGDRAAWVYEVRTPGHLNRKSKGSSEELNARIGDDFGPLLACCKKTHGDRAWI